MIFGLEVRIEPPFPLYQTDELVSQNILIQVSFLENLGIN